MSLAIRRSPDWLKFKIAYQCKQITALTAV